MFICTKCDHRHFPSINSLLHHVSLTHSHSPYFRHVCGISGCSVVVSSMGSYRTHVSRQHRSTATKKLIQTITCPVCSRTYSSLPTLVTHMKSHCGEAVSFACIFENCRLTFRNHSSFRSHLSRSHYSGSGQAVRRELLQNEEINDSSHDREEHRCCSDNIDDGVAVCQGDVTRSMALFSLKLQSQYNMPSKTVQKVVEDIHEMFGTVNEGTSNMITQHLQSNSISAELCHDISHMMHHSYNDPFACLGSNLKRSRYYQQNFGFVMPVSYNLGLNKFNKTCTFQYIPLLQTLQTLLRKDDIAEQVLHPPTHHPNVLRDFRDGSIFQKQEIFASDPHALQIMLYTDEVQLCNTLGSHRFQSKICAFYYVLGNIRPEFRSQTKLMQLALLCRSRDLKEFGIGAVLQPLLDDLKELSDVGIYVPTLNKRFHGCLAYVSGDNLASNSLGGFVECFSPNVVRYCRFCLASKSTLRESFDGVNHQRRTPEIYAHHVDVIKKFPEQSSLYGLKADSPLNEIPHFHVTDGLPPDVFHDTLDGICKVEILLVLKSLLAKNEINLTADIINYLITSFPYGRMDHRNKPELLSSPLRDTLVQNGGQTWCLLRLLPLMLGSRVPADDDRWLFLIELKEICDILFAPMQSVDVLSLQMKVSDHLHKFFDLFPDTCMKPKHHFISHYCQEIITFGRLINCWTMRYEAKHCELKRVVSICKNYQNVCYTLTSISLVLLIISYVLIHCMSSLLATTRLLQLVQMIFR